MQISRHWRINAQRYRLEGVRLEDGSVSLQSRQVPAATADEPNRYDTTYQPSSLQHEDSRFQKVAS